MKHGLTTTAARWLATVGGLGDRLPAPGTTAGSLPAALLWVATLSAIASEPARLIVTAVGVVIFSVVGCWAATRESARRGAEDPGPVVIDEVAGQWLTYLVAMPWAATGELRHLVVTAGAGFLLFRIFDIVKPWPVNRLEELPGGFGIMADDLGAAIYAGICLVILARWM